MSRLIDADALEGKAYEGMDDLTQEEALGARSVISLIEQAPTIDAAPVVQGKWRLTKKGFSHPTIECSKCGCESMSYYYGPHSTVCYPRWCQHCGAKMEARNEAD